MSVKILFGPMDFVLQFTHTLPKWFGRNFKSISFSFPSN